MNSGDLAFGPRSHSPNPSELWFIFPWNGQQSLGGLVQIDGVDEGK